MGSGVAIEAGGVPPAQQDISRIRLAVVTPMANEAAGAERFVREVLQQCRAAGVRDVQLFAVLDRASRDGTLDLLRALAPAVPGLRVIHAPENRGVVDAYFRGYREALAAGADWILEMDAGFSHPPDAIPRFLARIAEGCDAVFATRFAGGGTYAGGVSRRWLVSRGGSWLARLLLGAPLTDMTSGFQLFSRHALARIVAEGVRSRGPFFQTEIKVRLRDLRLAEVPIDYTPTAQGVHPGALADACRGLFRLFFERLRGAD
jgi:dolichol-phosphate mannosyltransferase